MSKYVNKFKRSARVAKKKDIIIYLVLRIIVVLIFLRCLYLGYFENAILSLITLFLLFMPLFIQKRFKITIPGILEIMIYIFIFSSTILGEVYQFYVYFPYFDMIIHAINGFLCASLGFYIAEILNHHDKGFKLAPLYMAIFAFCFSITLGVIWEFCEFSLDKKFNTDHQKDTLITSFSSTLLDESKNSKPVIIKDIYETIILNDDDDILATIKGGYIDIGLKDTMDDLKVTFLGAGVYAYICYYYLKKRDKKNLTSNFIIENN